MPRNWLCFARQPLSDFVGRAVPNTHPAARIGFVSHDRFSVPPKCTRKLALFCIIGHVAARWLCLRCTGWRRSWAHPAFPASHRTRVPALGAGSFALWSHQHDSPHLPLASMSIQGREAYPCWRPQSGKLTHGYDLRLSGHDQTLRLDHLLLAIQLRHYHTGSHIGRQVKSGQCRDSYWLLKSYQAGIYE